MLLSFQSFISVLLFSFVFLHSLQAQQLDFFDLNYSNYPDITAFFRAIDKNGQLIYDISKNEIAINENNHPTDILFFKPPSKVIEPLSVILVFDVSGSMKGERIKIAQQAAFTFIDLVKGSDSEVAITTFSNDSYINSDFTKNYKRLNTIVDNLSSFGGTYYDSAFMQSQTGIFKLSEHAKYKKVVIFMTDGQSKANTDTIISTAQKMDMAIYATTIELAIPESLKEISLNTGGNYYEQINDPRKARNIYTDLFHEIASSDLGMVKWKAAPICERERDVSYTLKNLQSEGTYSLERFTEDNFLVRPKSIFIGAGMMGKEVTRTFILTCTQRPVTITNIYSDLPGIISIDTSLFPMNLSPNNPGHVRFKSKITANIQPKAKIYIETKDCIENTILDVLFGEKGKIEIVTPKGGEIFAAGSMVDIEWKGVTNNQEVALFYKYNDHSWRKIDQAKGLKYKWEAPGISDQKYQVKAQTVGAYQKGFTQQLTDKNNFLRLYDVSNDGSLIVYSTHNAYVKIMHTASGLIIRSSRGGNARFGFLSPDNKRFISFYNYSFGILDLYNNNPEQFVNKGKQGFLFAAYNSNTGDEYLMPSKIDPLLYPNEQKKVIDYVTGEQYFINPQRGKLQYACITKKKGEIITIDDGNVLGRSKENSPRIKRIAQIEPGYKKLIVSPNGDYIYIHYPRSMEILSTVNGKTLFNSSMENYLRFSPDGVRLMTVDSAQHINIWDFDKKKKILSVPYAKYCNFSPSGRFLHYYIDNKVHIYDLINETFILEQFIPGVSMIRISTDDQEFLVIRFATCETYNLFSGELNTKITSRAYGGVRNAFFDINNTVLVHSASQIDLWEAQSSFEPGISNPFTIVAPKPTVIKEFDFGQQEIGTKRETVIDKAIKNLNAFPVKVVSIVAQNNGGAFELVSQGSGFNIDPNNSKNIEVAFTPVRIGPDSTQLIVNTPDSSYLCILKGTGIAKQISVTGRNINFGMVLLGQQKDTVALFFKNISKNTLNIEKIEIRNFGLEHFTINQPLTTNSLIPESTLEAELTFKPKIQGFATALVQVFLEESANPVNLKLLGEGIQEKKLFIKGEVLNRKDSTFLSALVKISDVNRNSNLDKKHIAKGQPYLFEIDQTDPVILYAEKEGYISGSISIDPMNYYYTDTINRNLYLSALEAGNQFSLNGIYFESGKYQIQESSKSDLLRVLQLLNSYPEMALEIHGHTDYIGSTENNMGLSKNRALAVKTYLSNFGIDKNRLSIKFFGEERPVATNETEEGREQNRRIEFIIKNLN